MTEATVNRRNVFVIVLAGLILGSVPIMLWLGRWKLALAYLILGSIVAVSFYLLPIFGLIRPLSIQGVDSARLFSLVRLPVSVLGVIHAIMINGKSLVRPWYSRWYIALVAPTAIGFLLAYTTITFLYQPFNAPAASNIPSLMIGDHFIVSKTAYTKGTTPQRGDMAVFKLPTDTRIDYVKRVVGLPEDRIQMIHGVLNINGVPVKLEEVQLAPEFYQEESLTYYRETLPSGRSYVVANRQDDGMADNTIEYVVPAGHYFAMGDNRDNSEDSRFLDAVGYIPEENFVGRVGFRFWNSQGFSLANRPEEIYPAK
ncbi:MAG: signal peptidase I [Aestuariivirga sp.]